MRLRVKLKQETSCNSPRMAIRSEVFPVAATPIIGTVDLSPPEEASGDIDLRMSGAGPRGSIKDGQLLSLLSHQWTDIFSAFLHLSKRSRI